MVIRHRVERQLTAAIFAPALAASAQIRATLASVADRSQGRDWPTGSRRFSCFYHRLLICRLTRFDRDSTVVGLGDEESAVAPGCRDGLVPARGLGWCQRSEDLLLVALDALRSRHHRDELRKAFELLQPLCRRRR